MLKLEPITLKFTSENIITWGSLNITYFLKQKNYKNLKQNTQCKKISSKIDYEMVSDSLYDFYLEYFKAPAFLAVLKLFIANTILEKQQ